MFDAQNLLGGLLKEATGSRGLASKASLGIGALGVAMAAYEHFTQERTPSSSGGAVNQRASAPPTQPPATSGRSAPPPPPPGAASAPPPPAPPVARSGTPSEAPPVADNQNQDALLLIDAMIAAANADGHIDALEQSNIFRHLHQINSDQEGIEYVMQRLANPPSLSQICQRVNSVDQAQQVYLTSLIAITVDTEQEAQYLKRLAESLQLTPEQVSELNQQIES